jgi:hypothetical protein
MLALVLRRLGLDDLVAIALDVPAAPPGELNRREQGAPSHAAKITAAMTR